MTPPLATQQCQHQAGPALTAAETAALLPQTPGWSIDQAQPGGVLHQTFKFADFHHTMAFVNALAWIAHQQDHHPDIDLSYNRCTVRWSTHSTHGLSINDFICAARVDQLSA